MGTEDINSTVIIGAGSAGLTAAIYTARSHLAPLVISGTAPGGQLSQTTTVDNFPGFPEGIEGSQLMERMKQQAKNFGAEFKAARVTDTDFSTQPKKLILDNDENILARSVIIASGATARWLGLDSEQKYRGHGVSACATCDGFFFQDQEVLVIGGGDAAVEEALFLTKFAKRVRILHRRDNLRASSHLAKKAKSHNKIEMLWNTELTEVLGDGEKVTGARVITHPEGKPKRKIEKNSLEANQQITEKELECDGIFMAIGHSPNTGFLKNQIKTDDRGYILTENEVFTEVEGVFAAGDVADSRYQQAVTACGSGCKAALEIEKYLQK